MKAQAGGAEGSVCFFAQDIVPDQLAESEELWDTSMISQDFVAKKRNKPSQACLLMAYLRAGGRVVWVGDIPFYYMGRRGGEVENWGIKGQKKVLGLDSIWDVKDEPRLTEAGREWWLTSPGNASRCVPARRRYGRADHGGGYAMAFFKNFNPELPGAASCACANSCRSKTCCARRNMAWKEEEAEQEAEEEAAPERRRRRRLPTTEPCWPAPVPS